MKKSEYDYITEFRSVFFDFKDKKIDKDNAIHACGAIEDKAFEVYPDSPIDGEIPMTSAQIIEMIITLNNIRNNDK